MNDPFSLFDYFADHETDSNLSLNESSKAFAYDVGEELKGSRKHLASLMKFSTEWYDELERNPTLAYKLVCKDELAGDISPDGLRNQGFQSETAYALKLLWDRVASRPEDSMSKRGDYVFAINKLKEMFERAFTEELFRDSFSELKVQCYKGYLCKYPERLKNDPELINYRFWMAFGDRFLKTFYTFGKRGKLAGSFKLFEKAFNSDEGKNWRWAQPKKKTNSRQTEKNNGNVWCQKRLFEYLKNHLAL